jgi:SEC-C motif-containing protein
MSKPETCPCGSGGTYEACCGRFVEGRALPETAEELMRARYTAYTLGRGDYLRTTWHPTTRRNDLHLDDPVIWLGLDIKRTEAGGANDREGMVEFVARYKVGGRAHRLHEISRFVRREGRWFYVDGETGQSGT